MFTHMGALCEFLLGLLVEGRRDRNSENYLSFTHGRPARVHITFEYRNGGVMFTSPDKMDKCNAKPIAVKDLGIIIVSSHGA